MWEHAINILKILGALAAIVAAVALCARLWGGATKDQLIKLLKDEVEISRGQVQHYRDEMHATREECAVVVTKSLLELDVMKEGLKEVEIENAGLRVKTDLSPVMGALNEFMTENREFVKEQREFVKEQTLINAEMLEAFKLVKNKLQGEAVV